VSGERLRKVTAAFALLTAVLGSLIAAPGPDGLCGSVLAALMLAITVSDAERYIIPNELVAAALALALLRAAAIGPDAGWLAVAWTVVRAAAIALPLLALMEFYRRWRGRDGLGLGDVKLAGVAGAWLGWTTIFAALELAALAALAAYLLTALLRRRTLRGKAFLPFGAFLAPCIWLGWLAEAIFS